MTAARLKQQIVLLREADTRAGRHGASIEEFKREFAKSRMVKDGLNLPVNAALKEKYPTSEDFADWLFGNPVVDFMRDRMLLKATVVEIFTQVLLTEDERKT